MSLLKKRRNRRKLPEISNPISGWSLCIRTTLALSLATWGVYLLSKACAADLFFTVLPIIVAGLILTPVVCQSIASPIGSLFWPKFSGPEEPVYSTAHACRYRGRYDEAISHYRQITNEFPAALQAHIALIEMTAIDMDDIDMSKVFFIRAKHMIADTDKHRHLTEIFEAAGKRYDAAHLPPVRLKIELPGE